MHPPEVARLALITKYAIFRDDGNRSELELYFKAKDAHAKNASSYGVLGSAGISAGAFLIPPGSTIPEIQLTFFPRKSEPHISNSSDLNHTAEILFTVALLTPKARNRVILTPRSNDSNAELIPRVASEVPEVEQEEHLRGDDVWKLSWGVGVVREIASVLGELRMHTTDMHQCC